MTDNFKKIVAMTGANDYFIGRHRCPAYWRGCEEEKVWQEAYNQSKKACRRDKR